MTRFTETKVFPNLLVTANTLADNQWQSISHGVDIHYLYKDDISGAAAALIRYAPNSQVKPHQHLGYEHIFVLSGEQSDELNNYPQGCFAIQPPSSQHTIKSTQGCIVLAVWTAPLKFTQ